MAKSKDHLSSTSNVGSVYKIRRFIVEAKRRSKSNAVGLPTSVDMAANQQPVFRINFKHADVGKPRTARFGAVTVVSNRPDADTVDRNITAGRDALNRAVEALVKPGVDLKLRKGVPQFRADTENPKMLIRDLDGAIEKGRIIDGKFVPAV